MDDEGRLRKKAIRNYAEDGENPDSDEEYQKKPDRRAKRANDNNDGDNEVRKRQPASKKRRAASSQNDSDGEDDLGQDEFEEIENDELHPFETGQILKVYVEDFMCHKRMTVDFGRHVNFVTGQNGSGKSAVVAAIQLCLGVTARTTGRGKSLGALIREGTEGPAKMRVTLLNEGVDAYKPEKYGKRITVERTINNRNGGGGYRLLGEKGDVVSQEKRELDNILRTFNIYGDNPCCILTQEESKKFIQGHEKDKYEFFLKATGLQRTKEELESSQESLELTRRDLETAESKFPGKKEQVDKLKKELQDLIDLDQYDDEIRMIFAKMFWLDAYVANGIVEELESKLRTVQEELQGSRNRVTEAEHANEEIGNFDELNAILAETQEEQTRLSAVADERRTAMNNMGAEIKKAERQIRQLQENKKNNMMQMDAAKKEIQDRRKKALESAAEDQRKYLTEIEQCEKHIATHQERLMAVRDERANASQTCAEYQRGEQQLSGEVRGLQNEVQRMERDYREISSSSDGRIAAFGPKIPKVLSDIKGKRFRGPVIGPIGAFVKIRRGNEDWGREIERVIGKVMSSFVVTNIDDQRTLKAILRANSCDYQHSIIVQSGGESLPRYNVGTIPDALSVNDAIVIENDLVFNTIVDQCRTEGAALFADDVEVQRYVVKSGNGDSFRHPQMQRAICKNGLTISFRGGNRATEQDNFPYKRLLSADAAETLANLVDEINMKKTQLQEARAQHAEVQSRLTEMHQQMQRLDAQARTANDEIKRFSRKKSDNESYLEELRGASVVDTSALEQEVEQLTQAIETVDGQITEREAYRDGLSTEMKELKSALKEAEQRRDEILNKLREQEERLERFLSNQDAKKKELERARADLAKRERQLAEVQKLVDEKQEEREKMYALATEKTKTLIENWDEKPIALDARDTKKNLESKSKSLQAKVKHARQQAGLEGKSRVEISDRLQKARADFREAVEIHKKLQQMYDNLVADTAARRKRWNKQLRENQKVVTRAFDMYLQKKGYAGAVRFDHDEKTLHLTCQVDNQDDTTRTEDVRQLSGGERSYATLCLLMALGHVIECPFRLMDEYDVFLDDVARKITLTALQRYAESIGQRGRQLIIVTPHNLADVRTSGTVRIRKMAPPERHRAHGLQQQVLPFGN